MFFQYKLKMSELTNRSNDIDNSKFLNKLSRKTLFSIFFICLILDFIESRVKIISPPELKNMFGGKSLKASLSNFGNIPYGYKIIGKVYFNPENIDDEMACKNITGINIDQKHDIDEVPIVMIDRGNCHFVTKVRNVENIGGHIALIVNNVKVQDIDTVIMGDDGHGKSITIPGVLISKEDGEILKTYYTNNKDKINSNPIILEVDFEMETSDNLVTLDVYFESNDFNMLRLLRDIYIHDYFYYLKDSIKFTPRFVTFVHPQYNFTEFNDVKSKDCIAGGRYCATSRDLKITGKDVIKQNLKMKCAYEKSSEGNEDTYYAKFLSYIDLFYTACCDASKEDYFSEACSAINLQFAGYDVTKINECYANGFSPAGVQNIDQPYTRNRYLDKDNEDKKNNYLKMIPSVLINNRTYYGALTPENIFEAICAGFSKKPEVCYTFGAFTKNSSTMIVVIIILVVVLVNVVIFILCRRYLNRRISDRIQSADINEKINSVVSNYLALRDQNK